MAQMGSALPAQNLDAMAALAKVVVLYPDDPVANNQLGLVHGYLEDYEQSLKYYLVCVGRRGAPYLYYGNAASAYANLGRYGKARELLEEFLRTSPESGVAHLALADISNYEGRYDLALAEADKARQTRKRRMMVIVVAALAVVGGVVAGLKI